MKVVQRLLLAAAVFFALQAGSARAVVHIINVQNFAFMPPKTTVNWGDTVRWVLVEGFHNSISEPSSAKSWTSPTLDVLGETFQIQITAADGQGPFPYICSFHNFPPFNMVDTILVFPGQVCCVPGNKLRGDVSTSGGAQPNGDGATDGSDLGVYVDYIFFGDDSSFRLDCPDVSDLNADATTDGGDLGVVVDYIFFGDTSVIKRCDGSAF